MFKQRKSFVFLILVYLFLVNNFLGLNIYSKTSDANIEELKLEISEKSEEIEKNEEQIEFLENQITDLEEKISNTDENIEQTEIDIDNREDNISSYLQFMQRFNNEKIWLKALNSDNIFVYMYNLNNLIDYIGKDFTELQATISILENKKKEYNNNVEALTEDKNVYEKETDKLNKTYKSLNEELKELEAAVDYEIEYDEDAYVPEENREQLMLNANISYEDFWYADYIISNESSWNYKVKNPYSDAYGLCQSLPGDKMSYIADDWEDNPITQLTWCDWYANTRYGSWQEAQAFWEENYWW